MNLSVQVFVSVCPVQSQCFVQATSHRTDCRRDLQPCTVKICVLEFCNVKLFLKFAKKLVDVRLTNISKTSLQYPNRIHNENKIGHLISVELFS